MRIRYTVSGLALAMLLMSACSNPEATAPTSSAILAEPTAVQTAEPTADEEIGADEASSEEAVSETADDGAAADSTDESAAASAEVVRPAWQQLPLTNARTGETFTLADYAGKVVYVEPFATWCTNCRRQLNNVNQVSANYGGDVIFIVLSVEPNIGDPALVQYATDHGFDMIFAAMSPDLLRETVAIFGQTFTIPPATPHFVIRADGSTTDLFTGIASPEEITALLEAS